MSTDRSVSLHVSRSALWALALLLVGPWVAISGWLLAARAGAPAKPARAPSGLPARTAATDAGKAHPGPWGDLEYVRILLEPPEEFVLADYTQAETKPWLFKLYSAERLEALWRDANLDASQLAVVRNPANRQITSEGILVTPGRDFIIGLNPAARARIYGALSEFPENFAQFNPYRLRASATAGWFDNSDLPPAVIELTRRLFYQRGTATCFSDEAIVLPLLTEPAQRIRYIKALARKSALMVYLHIRPGQEVDRIADYWGRGGRSKDLKPLLQSLARRPEGGVIDIVHLVPRFARLLAYTYPLPSENPVDANHDCHWTSLNFQNDLPDETLADISSVRRELMSHYYPVLGEPALGDIIMFVQKDGVVLHSCVYIADDIVFTKNGPAFSVPWLFSPLADVQAYYSSGAGVEMRRYRLKRL